jgi:hypothetical protein
MAHRTVNSHCPVHTGQSSALSGALSGAPLKFNYETCALGFLLGEPFPWAILAPPSRGCTGQSGAHRTVRCTPDSPVHTGQSGAHRTVRCPKARKPIFCFMPFFKSVFGLTCEYVLECHLALYVSVNMHKHYTRTLLVKLLIDNPS